MVVVGGSLPPQDHEALRGMGVAEVFGPGTELTDAAMRVFDAIEAALAG